MLSRVHMVLDTRCLKNERYCAHEQTLMRHMQLTLRSSCRFFMFVSIRILHVLLQENFRVFSFSGTRGRRALDFTRRSWAMTELHLGLHTDSAFG